MKHTFIFFHHYPFLSLPLCSSSSSSLDDVLSRPSGRDSSEGVILAGGTRRSKCRGQGGSDDDDESVCGGDDVPRGGVDER